MAEKPNDRASNARPGLQEQKDPDVLGNLSPPEATTTSENETETDGEVRGDPDPVPDGGLQAWLQVVGSWVILVNTWGLVNSFGVFQAYYETHLLRDTSSSNISWIGSLQGALLLMVGVVSGPLYDAGYFRSLLIGGQALIVLGQLMTSICHEYWQVLLAQGICIGLGMGFSFLPSTVILSQYFARRRALVLGISSSGSPLAGIVLPIIFSRLEPHIGFGWATRVIGFLLLGLSVIPVVFMRTRVPLQRDPGKSGKEMIDRTAFKDWPFVFFVVGNVFAFLGLYVPFFYTQIFAVAHHAADPGWAPYLVTLLNAGSVFGRIVPNAMADYLGSVNALAVCTAVSTVMALAWLGIRSLGGLIAFALLYGAFSGGVVSLTSSVIVCLSPDMSRVGQRMGMSFFLAGISLLVGTPIAGAILAGASEAQWMGTIAYGAASLLVASLFQGASRFVLFRRGKGWRA